MENNDIAEKRKRIVDYLEAKNKDAMILFRQDNFSWYTGGGSSKVLITSEISCAALLFTKTRVFLVAHWMDGQRILDEEMAGVDIEPVILFWHQGSVAEKALSLVKGLQTVSDVLIEGAENRCDDIYKLHFPLMQSEVKKLFELGRQAERIIHTVANEVKPGMIDYEVEAMLLYEFAKINAIPEVILVGADERIANYRHCIPRGKKIEKTVLIHPALRKDGLHANVARTVSFGDVSEQVRNRYEAACEILAQASSLCESGKSFYQIHQLIKKAYSDRGFADEWDKHYVGGASGYAIVDFSVCFDPQWFVSKRHAFDWFITITGAKVEELIIFDAGRTSVASVTGLWPTKEYLVNGEAIHLPQILYR